MIRGISKALLKAQLSFLQRISKLPVRPPPVMPSNITTMIYNDPLLTESPTPTPMHTAKNSLESEPPNLQRLRDAAHENGQREREIDEGDESVIRYHENLHKESFVPSTVQYTHLAAYFIFNLVLTIYNKIVLQKVSHCLRSALLCQAIDHGSNHWHSSLFPTCLPLSTPRVAVWAA